ncbi:flagellar biosynthesis protein FlhB [Acetonema longum]|uniref:Flagellar biosynthetic protein FlhB n=1 Tax=Acetonema longum DSM 6540 TaxID=1009370 RepID=F7NL60_9FIRM|nr:flagellar biosynthesis protein FlhB [Acetonema longum]EGO63165.1 flagellar biosynthetic protein FlhB [Acetonema longum DSM 6540]
MLCIKTYTDSWRFSDRESLANRLPVFDLQLFSEEKTEEPTSKRRTEAREKGQVARSVELNSAFIILTAFYVLKMIGSQVYHKLIDFMRFMFTDFSTRDFSIEAMQTLFINIATTFIEITFPLMLAILVISLTISFLQVGFTFTLQPLAWKFDKLNPINGFKRIFSSRSLVELAKSLLKIAIIGYFIYRFLIKEIAYIPRMIDADLNDSIQFLAAMAIDLAFQIGGVILILAAFDYFYQWWSHNKSLKMSKQEVKEEFKQTEGNPQIKGKIRERQRAMAMRRMMQEVPKATVVVTNPTHFAIAIRYEKDMNAPLVVAKGQDFLAERIKDLARQHGVVIVENKPLARTLYATTEVGESIPTELYQAVAEVLAYVYKLKRRLS